MLIVAWYAFRPERLVVNRQVAEAMPTAQSGSLAQPLESGQFYSILHPTGGTATIYQLGDGTRLLRLTNFKTSNGPDVHVYMVAADDAKDVATVEKAGFIDLGVIKGNVGDQNYMLGSDLDLSKYRAVSIWCKRFSTEFRCCRAKAYPDVAKSVGSHLYASRTPKIQRLITAAIAREKGIAEAKYR